jgi:Family of unknown function (DUF5675)
MKSCANESPNMSAVTEPGNVTAKPFNSPHKNRSNKNTMNLKVQRKWLTPQSTIGELTVADRPDDALKLYTLEPIQRTDGAKPRAIPAGTYALTIRISPKHGRLIPHVEGVPGFSEIEIHVGNQAKDTEGCTLVGRTRPETDFIGQSHAAFDCLFALLMDAATPPDEHGVYRVGFITYSDPGKEA